MKKSLILLLSLITLVACQNSPQSNGQPVVPSPKKIVNCLSESDTNGIVGGDLVTDTDPLGDKIILLWVNDKLGNTFICSATAIAPDVLLTAAHCLENVADNAVLAVFHHDLFCDTGYNVNDPNQNRQSIKVAVDPSYSPDVLAQNDLGLVKLNQPIPDNYEVVKIYDGAQPVTSGTLTLTGFGITYEADKQMPRLRSTTRDIATQVQTSGQVVNVQQSDDHGICEGDSGGPMLVNIAGEYEVYGVNSVVRGPQNQECHGDSFGMYVPYFSSWLQSTLDSFAAIDTTQDQASQ